ncbi:superoxide dismutase [Zopfochytrium polystomum]|nr:superoxide dismutase [Zopfochytrium polystomum]
MIPQTSSCGSSRSPPIKRLFGAVFLILALISVGTAAPTQIRDDSSHNTPPPTPFQAIALLRPTTGNKANGVVVFSQSEDFKSTTISIAIEGLTPNTQFAIHFHAFGDVSDPAGANVFGHFNPTNKPHGCDSQTSDLTTIHSGDIGNITSAQAGTVSIVLVRNSPIIQSATLHPNSLSNILGHAVAIHAAADDCRTQPTGNSGGKIATGVLGWANGTAFPKFTDFLEAPVDFAVGRKEAIVVFSPTDGVAAVGFAFFAQENPGEEVVVTVAIDGLAPNSVHGIHVHNFGDITDTRKAAKIGLHFNPFNQPHSCLRVLGDTRHAGDLSNLVADKDGKVRATIRTSKLSLFLGEEVYALGRALAIHANNDDCHSEPTGNSGDKLLQGVIGLRNTSLPLPTFEAIFGKPKSSAGLLLALSNERSHGFWELME